MTLYDCFPLFNELDILDIRLAELYPVVDRFVIVEATTTHSGQPKPLHYAENRHRWAAYNEKIIYVVVPDMPMGEGIAATRRREMFQRNAILRGLIDARDDDIALISDADEIPRRETFTALANGIPDGMVVTYWQKLFYYNFNTFAPDRPWPGTRAARVADIRAMSPHVIRNGLGQPDSEYPQRAVIQNAGWHCSYFGDVEHIQRKMRAFLHQELVTEENLDADTIARRMGEGLDIWGRTAEQRFVVGAASDLPIKVRCDPARFLPYFHPDWRPTFHEDWYPAEAAAYLGWLAQQAPEGAIVEIGCWEGRSTVALAQAVQPRMVDAVDHWLGNGDEEEGHPAATAAAARDVKATFDANMKRLTDGNVWAWQMDWRDFIEQIRDAPRRDDGVGFGSGIAFLHLDASHDYESVRDCLLAILPYLVPGAILCGDDAYGAGVYTATREVLGSSVQEFAGRMWVWQNNQT